MLLKSSRNCLKPLWSIRLGVNRCITTEAIHAELKKIRNIGVIAHIDAGKTTTTERMLYYSGYTQHIGNVDDGNTVMDYMEQERERGITITSAAITFFWKQFHINLIDTPGHVDFTIEVERALRVLDGAVAIFDASAGVEAQSLTVWRQASRYNIPRIAYINKMDKFGADFYYSIKSIEKHLNTIPVLLQIPIGKEKTFIGVIDVINMTMLTWNNDKSMKDDGKSYEVKKLTEADQHYQQAFKARMSLIERLAHADETFAELLLEKYDLKYELIDDNILLETRLRKLCLNSIVTPILCGSSFKNIAVQPLLDAIIKYLPNPSERQFDFQQYYDDSLCALCFKTLHEHRGLNKKLANELINETGDDILSFVRVYNGELTSKSRIYNATKNMKENCDKLFIPYAREMQPIKQIGVGNIAVVSGLKHTTTGDTLLLSEKAYENALGKLKAKNVSKNNTNLILAGIQVPPPVYFCSIEVSTPSEITRLVYALKCLQREDPSLKVNYDEDFDTMGQIIVQGMGELHLDIIKERILKEYGLKVYFGPLEIAYKEKPCLKVTKNLNFERIINGKKNTVYIEMTLLPTRDHVFETVKIIRSEEYPFNDLSDDQVKAIDHGIKSALNSGFLMRYPIIDCEVHLTAFRTTRSTITPIISSASNQCIRDALNESSCVIIQPIMNLEITASNEYASKVTNDLTRRHSKDMQTSLNEHTTLISCKTPLAHLRTLSSDLRRLTSGHTTFSIEFDSYEQISQKEYQELIDKN